MYVLAQLPQYYYCLKKKCLTLNKSRARLYNFLLHTIQKKHRFGQKFAWHAMTYSNSWTESRISSVADTGISSQGLWRQQNLSWTWSNREPQTMPIIIAAFYPVVTFIHHPQPEESCKISPLSERLMATLAPSFCASAYSFLPCENQPRSFSLSGPPFLLPRLLWDRKRSPVCQDHSEMERCQLLTIPRMHRVTISPWQTVWWEPFWYTQVTFLSEKTLF